MAKLSVSAARSLERGSKLRITLSKDGIENFGWEGAPEVDVTVSRVVPGCKTGKTLINAFGPFNFPTNEIGFYVEGDDHVKSIEVMQTSGK